MLNKVKCIVVDDEPIARDILEAHLSKLNAFELVGSCKSAIEAFQIINNETVDLIFLDINMPEISGLSFAKSINKKIKIIFTTAYREYAVEGFDLRAVDYLLKPISFDRFLQAVDKFNDEYKLTEQVVSISTDDDIEDHIFVRADRKMIKVRFADIQYIESLSDYIKIHLKDKIVVTRETISNIEVKLPQKNFIRTHRSFIVAIDSIDSFTPEVVEVNGHDLPISRGYKLEVLAKLNND